MKTSLTATRKTIIALLAAVCVTFLTIGLVSLCYKGTQTITANAETSGTAISSADDLSSLSEGTYYLSEDIKDLSSTVTISSEVTIDLNGYTLSASTCHTVTVAEGGTLTVKDSSTAQTGTIANTSIGGYYAIENNGTLNLTGGTITAVKAVYQNSGTLTMTDGTVLGTNKNILATTWPCGIRVNSGTADITGGTVSVYAEYSYNEASNFKVTVGYAIYSVGEVTLSGNTNITAIGKNNNVQVGGVYMSQNGQNSLTVNDGVTIKATYESTETGSSPASGILIFGNGNAETAPSLTINGGYIYGQSYGICGNGSQSASANYSNTEITINGGEIESDSVGIYHPEIGYLTITGGSITAGYVGVQMCAGTLTVTGGEITVKATSTEIDSNDSSKANKYGDGVIYDGAAISIINRSGYGTYTSSGSSVSLVTITGGTFTSSSGVESVQAYSYTQGKTSADDTVNSNTVAALESTQTIVEIMGGTYSSDLSTGTYSKSCITTGLTTSSVSSDGTYSIALDKTASSYENYKDSVALLITSSGITGCDSISAALKNEAIYNETESTYTTTTITIWLNKDTTEDITIPANLNVTLDLCGYTITNSSSHTIKVESGATLTINDSGHESETEAGTIIYGTVDNVTHGKAAIYSEGLVVLNGGSYTRSNENSVSKTDAGTNSYYVIENKGTMIINSGVTVGSYNSEGTDALGKYSSLIRTLGTGTGTDGILIINEGTFIGGLNTVKCDDYSTLTINGGTFSNTYQYVIMAWTNTTINGGTFTVSNSGAAVVWVGYYEKNGVLYAEGQLTINGGTFNSYNGEAVVEVSSESDCVGDTVVNLNGGTYNGTITDGGSGTFTITSGTYNGTITAGENTTFTITGGTYDSTAVESIQSLIADENVTINANIEFTSADGGKTYTAATYDVKFIKNGTTYLYNDDDDDVTASGDYSNALEYVIAQMGTNSGEYEIILGSDYTLTSTLTVSSGQTLTLDLNGYTLTSSEATNTIKVTGSSAYLTVINGTIFNTYDDGTKYKGQPEAITVFNGATVVIGDGAVIESSFLGIRNGNKDETSNGGTVIVEEGATITAYYAGIMSYGDVTVNGGTITGDNYGITFYGNNSESYTQVVINGGTITGKADCAIAISAETAGNTYAKLIINDGTITSEGAKTAAIYLPGQYTVTEINGGTITGVASAVELRNGSLTITDGTFTATTSTFGTSSGSDESVYGAAIAISAYAHTDITVSITGGTFSGYYAVYEYYVDGGSTKLSDAEKSTTVFLSLEGGTYTSTASGEGVTPAAVSSQNDTAFITGGVYNTTLNSEYLAEGLAVSSTASDGYYGITISTANAVAAVYMGGTSTVYATYETLAAAFTDIADGYIGASGSGTRIISTIEIKLYADITASESITNSYKGYAVTLNLNGHTLSFDSGATLTNSGELVITNNTSEKALTFTAATAITNSGTLTIEDYVSVVNNYSNGIGIKNETNGYLYIEGGSVSSTLAVINYGYLEVNSGSITGDGDGIDNYSGTVVVNGGSITGKSIVYSYEEEGETISGTWLYDGIYNSYGTVKVYGGTITGVWAGIESVGGSVTVSDDANITVNVSVEDEWAYGIYVDTGSLTISGNALISATNSGTDGAAAGIVYFGDKTAANPVEITINGGTIYGQTYGMAGNGSWSYSEITISGGYIEGGVVGIYHPEDGNFTMTGGSVVGYNAGIQFCAGTINISGGSVTATIASGDILGDGDSPYNKTDDGAITDGAAISIINRSGYGTYSTEGTSVTVVNLTGGTFTSADGVEAVQAYSYTQGRTKADDGTISGENTQAALSEDQSIVAISGGIYSSALTGDYSSYCFAAGAVIDTNTNTVYATAADAADSGSVVASIGSYGYSSLQDAIDAAEDDETVTLITDRTEYITITGNKSITLDLNGYTLKNSKTVITVNNGVTLNLTSSIAGGTVQCTYTGNGNHALLVCPDCKATVGANVVLTSSSYSTIFVGESTNSSSSVATLEVYGTVKNTRAYGGFAITGNGNDVTGGTVINVYEGAYIYSAMADGIFHPQVGTLTVYGGTIEGAAAAIEMRSGTLIIHDGTFTSPWATFSANASGSGNTVVGVAIAISQHTTDKDISVTINGGTFSGIYAFYENDLQNSSVENIAISINGGTFTSTNDTIGSAVFADEAGTLSISGGSYSDTSALSYLAENAVLSADSLTVYKDESTALATETTIVAAVGGLYFTTLQAAVNYAADIGTADTPATVTLIADSDENITIYTGAYISLDLNGKTLTGTITNYGGTLTITDTNSGTGTVTGAISSYNGALTINNVTVSGDITVTGGSLTIASGTYTGTFTLTGVTTNITGGAYGTNTNVETYLAEGYALSAAEENNLREVVQAVATVNGYGYSTLQAAINAATTNDTITLIATVDLGTSTLSIVDKIITLNLNGYEIKSAAITTIDISGTTDTSTHVTIVNGTVSNTYTDNDLTTSRPNAIYVHKYATVVIDDGANIVGTYFLGIRNGYNDTNNLNNGGTVIVNDGAKITAAYAGIMSYGDVTVNGGEITGETYGITFYGNSSERYTRVTINGGTIIGNTDNAITSQGSDNIGYVELYINDGIITSKGSSTAAIYLPAQYGKTVITGGTITGVASGIEIRNGSLTIGTADGDNSNIIITSTTDSSTSQGVTPEDGGETVTGSALAIASYNETAITVTIYGGTFTGTSAVYESYNGSSTSLKDNMFEISLIGGTYNGSIYSQNSTGFISGGVYSDTSAAEYVTSGFVLAGTTNEDGYYTLAEAKTYAATVNGTGFATLQEAIDYAATLVGTESEPIEVTLNTAVKEDITVSAAEGKEAAYITLNLSGNVLTNASGNTITVNSGVTLTITGNGTIINNADSGAAIVNSGTVIVTNGKIISDYIGIANGIANNSSSKLTINGGTISAYNGIYGYGEITVTGGTINASHCAIWSIATTSISIEGGTMTAGDYAIVSFSGDIFITGGSISSDLAIYITGTSSTLAIGGANEDNSNIKISADSYLMQIIDGAIVKVYSGTLTSSGYGLTIFGDSVNTYSNLYVYGGSVTADLFAVSGEGSSDGYANVYIYGGTLTSTGAAAIYNPQQYGVTYIVGGTITGLTGVEVRGGAVYIGENYNTNEILGNLYYSGAEDLTITATGNPLSAESNYSGSTISGAAIAVATYNHTISLTVGKGAYSSASGYAVYEANVNSYTITTNMTVELTDGTFDGIIYSETASTSEYTTFEIIGGSYNSTTAAEYVKDGYALEGTLTEGYYGIVQTEEGGSGTVTPIVAQIGSLSYTTLQKAIDAADDGDTIKLVANVTTCVTISGKSIILDLNSYDISVSDNIYTIKVDSDAGLTVTDSSSTELADQGSITNSYSDGGYAIYNVLGSITINGGTINGTNGKGIYSYSESDTGSSSNAITINGGKITISGNGIAIVNKSSVEIIVNDGEIKGGIESYSAGTGKITVTGGTISDGGIYINAADLEINGGTIVDGITITDLSEDNIDITVTVNNCTISGTTGIYVCLYSSSTLTVNNCTITATRYGIHNYYGTGSSAIVVKNSTISVTGSVDYACYGIYMQASTGINISDCTITVKDNTTVGSGATCSYGIYINSGTATISGSTITGTECGIYIYGGTATIISGTMTATGNGGYGIYSDGKSFTVEGGTIQATGEGGYGIYIYDSGCTLNISGGTISGTAYGIYTESKNDYASTVNISGGYISGGTSSVCIGTNHKLVISGGYFKADIPTDYSYYASGCIPSSTKNTDGYYYVISGTFVTKPTIDTETFNLSSDTYTVTYSGSTYTFVAADTGYTVVNGTGTNVDTYTVTISLKNGYVWSDGTYDDITYTFIITKATNTFGGTLSINGWTYGSYSADDNSPSGLTATFGEVTYIYYTDNNGEIGEEIKNFDPATADAGKYWVKAYVAATSNYDAISDTASFTVDKIMINAAITITNGGWTYGTYNNEVVLNVVTGEYSSVEYHYYTGTDQGYSDDVDNFDPTTAPAGIYWVAATVWGTTNYTSSTAQAVKFVISPCEVAAPTEDSTIYTYNGNSQTYYIADSEYYTVSNATHTNAGTYTVTVALKDTANYVWSDSNTAENKTFEFTIAKVSVTAPTGDTTSFVYNGSEQTYSVTSIDSSCFTVSGNKQTYAGTYTVTVMLNDTVNYVWADTNTAANKTFEFIIAKVSVTVPDEDETEFTYNGEEQTYYIASSDYYTVSGATQTNAGTYTVTVTLKDTVNFCWSGNTTAAKEYTFTIAQKEIEVPEEDITEFTYNGEEQTYGIASNSNYTISNAAQTNAGTYTVTVTLKDSTNYKWSDGTTDALTFTFVIAKDTVETPAADETKFTYTGSALTYNIAESDKYTVIGAEQTEVGTYTVTVTLKDSANYSWSDGTTEALTYTFTIADSSVTITYNNTISGEVTSSTGFVIDDISVSINYVEKDSYDVTESTIISAVINSVEGVEIAAVEAVYDISLSSADGENVTVSQATDGGSISVKTAIPTSLVGQSFYIVHIHDGEVIDIITSDNYSVENGYVTFEVDNLSQFAFVSESAVEDSSMTSGEIITVCFIVGGTVAAVAALVMLVVLINSKRKLRRY